MVRRRILWLSAVVAAVGLSACGGGSGAKRATPTAPPEPTTAIEVRKGQALKIGVSAALSGEQKSLGADLADAVELAVRDRGRTLKGHPLAVARMDDGCGDAEKAVGVARSLAGDPAIAGVIGPMCTTGAQAADSTYEAARIVHILPAATRTDLSQQGERFLFRTAWLDDAQAHVQAAYALGNLHATSAVLVDDGEPYGKALADAFATAFESGGGSIASRERTERGEKDFAALARKVKSANADIAVFEGLNPEAALVVQALRKEGYRGHFIAPDGVLSARDFIESSKEATAAADGAIVTGGPAPDDAFVAKFRDAFQRPPGTPFVLQAHDAAAALLNAIESVAAERADGTLVIDRAELAETLRTRGLDGLTGTIRFDEHGDRSGDAPRDAGLAIYRVANGRFEAIP
jgi:branched-chain amino acid transport system substrate-binding protein